MAHITQLDFEYVTAVTPSSLEALQAPDSPRKAGRCRAGCALSWGGWRRRSPGAAGSLSLRPEVEPPSGAKSGCGDSPGRGKACGRGRAAGRSGNGLGSCGGREERREEGKKGRGRGVGGSRSAGLCAPTLYRSVFCPLPGHALPAALAPQSPRRPPEPLQNLLRRMGVPSLTPLSSLLLLLLMLGKPGGRPCPGRVGA